MSSPLPKPEDVEAMLEVIEPFFARLRAKHADAMIRTAPHDHDKREDLYVMCRGLDMVVAELKTFTTNARFNAAAAKLAEQEEDNG